MRKWWLNLLLLLAVIGLGFYAYRKPAQEEAQTFAISTLVPAQVTRLRIERGASTIELEKKAQAWMLTVPFAARADAGQVTRLLDVFGVKSKEKLAATDLARFDLDKPGVVLRVGEQSLAFGALNSLTQDQYVLSGDSVYLINSYHGMQIPDSPDRLLTHSLFAEGEKPVSIDVGILSATQKDGKWTVTRPAGAAVPADKELSQDDLNRWADDWRLSSSLMTQPYDLRPGIGQVRVTLADGKTLVLEVLQREPDLILARTDELLQFQYSTQAGKRLMDPQPEPPATSTPSALSVPSAPSTGAAKSAVTPEAK